VQDDLEQNDLKPTYPPLNTLKPVDDGIWIIDGPVIRFGVPGFRMPFPTRATIIRLRGGSLFVHSPTPLVAGLMRELEELGTPRWIIGPNRLHYWWIADWHAAYPKAEIYLEPKTAEQAGKRLECDWHPLKESSGYPWDHEIRTLPVPGSYMTEVVFFHVASSTLLVTDLIENFEASKTGTFWMRLLTWAGGVRDPDGSTPRDMRLSFMRNRAQVKAAVETMIAWNPERVVLAHRRWYACNGGAELRRAFRWILDR